MRDKSEDDVWEPLRFLLGKWSGTCSGKPGCGRAEREYRLVLKGNFIQVAGHSIFEPQEPNPEGEVHEEFGFFSFDRERGRHIYRESLAEGFVNRYVVVSADSSDTRRVLATEAIENLPPKWEARTTYEILGENCFRETFELREPDGVWDCYITSELRRAPDGPPLE